MYLGVGMTEYFSNITAGLKSFIEGLQLTIHHFHNRKNLVATLQYPHEKWPIEDRHIGFPLEEYNVIRSRLNVDIEDCIGCLQCERACPVDCIKINTIKPPKGNDFDCGITSNGTQKKMLVTRFSIDMTECMFCNLCVYPCPEDCIYMAGGPNSSKHEIEYEYASRDRDHLIFQFANPPENDIMAAGGENYLRARKGLPLLVPDTPVKTVETPGPKPASADEKPGVTILNGITDRMVRSVAKKAFIAADRAGNDPVQIAAMIKDALEEAGKFTNEAKTVLASITATQSEPSAMGPAHLPGAAPDIKILNVIEDKMARGQAKKIFMAESRNGKSPSEMVASILEGLMQADKLTPEIETIVRQLSPHVSGATPAQASPNLELDVKMLDAIEDRMSRSLAKKAFIAAQREGIATGEIINAIQTALSDADKLTDDIQKILTSISGAKV